MKCAWKKVLASARIADVSARMIDCLVNSAAYTARVNAGFGEERIARLLVSASNLMNETIADYAEDEREEDERVLTAAGSMSAELKCCGFDFRAAKKAIVYRDPFYDTYRYEREKEKHERRLEYVKIFDLAQTPIHLSFLRAARQEYKYGAERLEKFYAAIRADSDPFLVEYLRCTGKGDEKILEMLKDKQAELLKCGLQIR